MGYNTKFDFEVYKEDQHISPTDTTYGEPIKYFLAERLGYSEYGVRFVKTWEALFWDEQKWYDWESDMFDLSKTFPELTFVLYAEGEDSGDLWRAFAKNGEVDYMRAHIMYEKPTLDFAKALLNE